MSFTYHITFSFHKYNKLVLIMWTLLKMGIKIAAYHYAACFRYSIVLLLTAVKIHYFHNVTSRIWKKRQPEWTELAHKKRPPMLAVYIWIYLSEKYCITLFNKSQWKPLKILRFFDIINLSNRSHLKRQKSQRGFYVI